ncbi:MAG: hypothetical protein HBSAPP03_20430 [Phycisphaerae bacterium]|nr:MAG: hypothetical protein HBSAPP03_20430 [Phycisphaerae bacterium]
MLAVLAGSCASAMAQNVVTVTPEPIGQQRYKVAADGSITPMGGYDNRLSAVVWNNGLFGGVNVAGSTLGAFHKRHLMKVTWAPGPWATLALHQIDGIDGIGYGTPGWTDVPNSTIRLSFYAESDVSLDGFGGVGTSMINPSGTPAVTINLAYPQGLPRTGSGYGVGWDIIPAAADLPAGSYWLDAAIIDGSTGNPMPSTADHYRLWGGTTSGDAVNPCYQVGTGSNDMGYDRNDDGVYTGAAAPGSATLERTRYQFGPAAGQTNNRPLTGIWAFFGEVSAPAPVCGTEAEVFPVGADNVIASDTSAIGANGVKIYCVTITADAIDENYGYINIDTEGSDNAFALGLFDSTGTLIASNDGGGSGVLGSNSQLTFGIGRLAAAGAGGRQYDGRHYNGTAGLVKGLLAGTYYLYVVPSDGGAPAFGGGFTASGTGAGGNANVRIQTNATNLTAPPAAAAPEATHLVGQALEDPPVAPGAVSSGTVMAGGEPLWFSVNLCRDADGSGNDVTFQVQDGANTATFGAYIFNSAGNLVATAQSAAGLASVNFTGGLPAGLYYVGVTYNGGGAQGDVAPNAATNGRWHLRGRNLSSGYTMTTSILVNWADCPAACDPDVNCDGSANGVDVEVQELAVGGDFTDYCQIGIPNVDDGDFNRDGAVNGTDVEAVENAVGGVCP